MKKGTSLLITLILMSLVILPVKADDVVIESNDMINYDTQETYTDANDEITINKNVLGSTILVGNKLTTSGYTDGLLVNAGNEITVDGTSEYAILAGNSIKINGNVLKDTIVAGNIITTSSDSTFGRDVIIYGSNVTLSGSFSRNVTIHANTITIKGASITGNVEAIASKIIIDDDVKIDGKIKYNNSDDNEISDKATLNETQTVNEEIFTSKFTVDNVLSSLVGYVGLLVVFAIVALYCPNVFKKTENQSFDFMQILTTTGVGLLSVVLIPLLIILLFTLYIGTPLALIILALYIVSIYLSNMFMGYYVGKYVWTKFIKKDKNILLEGLVGITLLYVLSLIPYIGVISVIISFLCGFGLIIYSLKK